MLAWRCRSFDLLGAWSRAKRAPSALVLAQLAANGGRESAGNHPAHAGRSPTYARDLRSKTLAKLLCDAFQLGFDRLIDHTKLGDNPAATT